MEASGVTEFESALNEFEDFTFLAGVEDERFAFLADSEMFNELLESYCRNLVQEADPEADFPLTDDTAENLINFISDALNVRLNESVRAMLLNVVDEAAKIAPSAHSVVNLLKSNRNKVLGLDDELDMRIDVGAKVPVSYKFLRDVPDEKFNFDREGRDIEVLHAAVQQVCQLGWNFPTKILLVGAIKNALGLQNQEGDVDDTLPIGDSCGVPPIRQSIAISRVVERVIKIAGFPALELITSILIAEKTGALAADVIVP